jgi:hypothetical protein
VAFARKGLKAMQKPHGQGFWQFGRLSISSYLFPLPLLNSPPKNDILDMSGSSEKAAQQQRQALLLNHAAAEVVTAMRYNSRWAVVPRYYVGFFTEECRRQL